MSEHYTAPQEAAQRMVPRVDEHLHDRMQYLIEVVEHMIEEQQFDIRRAVKRVMFYYKKIQRLDCGEQP